MASATRGENSSAPWPRSSKTTSALSDSSLVSSAEVHGTTMLSLRDQMETKGTPPGLAPGSRACRRSALRAPPKASHAQTVPREVATIQRRAALQVLVSGRSDITPLDLLVALFRGADQRRPAPRALDLGEDPYRRVSATIEHPMTSLRQSGVTTAALRDEFALGALPAAELALQVHREGVGTLGTFRYGEVGAAVRRVEERAARLGFPLKVLVLEVDEG